MARRKRINRPIPSLTFRDLTAPPDDIEYIYDPGHLRDRRYRVTELGFTGLAPFPFDPERFSRDLDAYGPSVPVFADSNIYLAPTDQRIWDVLFKNRQLRIVAEVAKEIEGWLRDPRGINVAAHRVIQDARDLKNNAVSQFRVPEDRPDLVLAAEWYVNLLGLRKCIRPWLRYERLTETGNPAPNGELNDVIRKQFGERSQRLAISGEKGKVKDHRYHDEALVVLAIMHALGTGQHTILLTHDENVLEQFRKACWLIDTHYRSSRLAEMYASDPFAFVPFLRVKDGDARIRMALSDAFADDDVLLLRKPSNPLRELLPKRRKLIAIHCCLIRELIEIVTFGLSDQLCSVFPIKGRTAGRSTDKLGDKNCHVSLGPLMRQVGNWAAIGRDRTVSKGKFAYSMIDTNLVLNEHEGRTKLVSTSILVP